MRAGAFARHPALRRAGAVVAFLLVAAVAAAGVLTLLREQPPAAGRRPTTATEVELRAAPEMSAATVVRLAGGTTLNLVGRSADGSWLLAAPADRPEVVGWLETSAVRDAGPTAQLVLVTVSAGGVGGPTPATASPASGRTDLPDLVVQSAASKQNRLVIVVANVGGGDLSAGLFARVNGGPARRIDVAGKPLRPGDALEAVLNTEYVQRRATVSVEVAVDASAREGRTDNNRLDVVIAPDLPNDLAIASAVLDPVDGHLRVEVRNLSPIPIVGPLRIVVREAPPATRLLGAADLTVNLASDASELIDLSEVRGIPVARLAILLSSDALTDANPANDSFPR